jgi:hypothetical protein
VRCPHHRSVSAQSPHNNSVSEAIRCVSTIAACQHHRHTTTPFRKRCGGCSGELQPPKGSRTNDSKVGSSTYPRSRMAFATFCESSVGWVWMLDCGKSGGFEMCTLNRNRQSAIDQTTRNHSPTKFAQQTHECQRNKQGLQWVAYSLNGHALCELPQEKTRHVRKSSHRL